MIRVARQTPQILVYDRSLHQAFKSCAFAVGLFCLALSATDAAALGGPAGDDWPMFRKNLERTALSTSNAPDSDAVLWSKQLSNQAFVSSPAIAAGVLYVGGMEGIFHALDATTGDEKWTFNTGQIIVSSPAVANGRVFFGSYDSVSGKLSALDIDGNFLWRFDTETYSYSSPAVWEGKVYFAAGYRLYALAEDTGAVVWSAYIAANFPIFTSPSVANGNVFIATTDGRLEPGSGGFVYAFDATSGAFVWRSPSLDTAEFPEGNIVITAPAVARGKVYVSVGDISPGSLVPLYGRSIVALNATDGTMAWRFTAGYPFTSSPAVHGNRLYAGSYDRHFYAIDADTGAKVWDHFAEGQIQTSPAVADGKIFFTSWTYRDVCGFNPSVCPSDWFQTPQPFKLYALNVADGTPLWTHTLAYNVLQNIHSSPAVAMGNLYLSGPDGKVYAFGSGEPENQPPVADAGPDGGTECSSTSGSTVTLDGSTSSDPDSTAGTNDDIAAFEWLEGTTLIATGETANVTLLLGVHTITLKVTDKGGLSDTDDVIVTVQDTTAPTLSVSVSPNLLWPPNHKMVEIVPSYTVSDACAPAPSIVLSSVTSNEPDNGLGDGDTANDIQLAPGGQIFLRAERSGKGSGRIYTLTLTATDGSGNSTTSTATVTVPHDQGRRIGS